MRLIKQCKMFYDFISIFTCKKFTRRWNQLPGSPYTNTPN